MKQVDFPKEPYFAPASECNGILLLTSILVGSNEGTTDDDLFDD